MDRNLMSALAHGATLQRVQRFVKVPTPAAGAGWSFTIPGESVARVRGVIGKLTTSAIVANRQPMLQVGDGSSTFMALAAPSNIAASLAPLVSFAGPGASAGGSGAGGVLTSALPDLILPAGYVLSMVTTAIDVTDQWTQCVVLYEELLAQPFGVEQLRALFEMNERIDTSLAHLGGM